MELDFNGLYALIEQEALTILPFLWVIGLFLKNTLILKDKYIPWVLLVVGISTTIGILGFSIESIIQGTYVSGLAVFSHQLFKQTKKKE